MYVCMYMHTLEVILGRYLLKLIQCRTTRMNHPVRSKFTSQG